MKSVYYEVVLDVPPLLLLARVDQAADAGPEEKVELSLDGERPHVVDVAHSLRVTAEQIPPLLVERDTYEAAVGPSEPEEFQALPFREPTVVLVLDDPLVGALKGIVEDRPELRGLRTACLTGDSVGLVDVLEVERERALLEALETRDGDVLVPEDREGDGGSHLLPPR